MVGGLAVAGQLTAMFGQPGIGKSLIATALVGEAVMLFFLGIQDRRVRSGPMVRIARRF